MNNDSIGIKLKALRQARKMTQQDAADKMGLNRSTLSNYEISRRVPSLNELKKIAAFYGVGLDYFGIASKDEILEILTRAKEVFASPEISIDEKEELYKELMRLYLDLDKQQRGK